MAIPDWLNISQLSGSGDTIITITASTLEGLVERTTTLRVSGNTKYVDVEVTQAPHDYAEDYLTFDITSNGVINWVLTGYASAQPLSIEYRINGGEWTQITATRSGTTNFNVVAGDVVEFRGDNPAYSYENNGKSSFRGSTAGFKASGNLMSMVSSVGFENLTTLSEDKTFEGLFMSCTGLTDARNLVLPATALTDNCYDGMFDLCRGLVYSPKLPATTLAPYCYHDMFNGCYSLTTAPELPATVMQTSCYDGMFANCTGLTSAPALPATTLAMSCYYGMFKGCTSLTTAPALPATTLASSCYVSMFEGCTSLTASPVLPAPTMVGGCYTTMFYGCSNLSRIDCYATNPSVTGTWDNPYTRSWVDGVAASGTFVKAPTATWEIGVNGIPVNWVVMDNFDADITATYNFSGSGGKILNKVIGLDDYMAVDGVVQPIATSITTTSGVHTVRYKSRINGQLAWCDFSNVTALTDVVISDTIEYLDGCSFLSSTNLSGMTLSNNLKAINKHVYAAGLGGMFDGSKIATLNLPSSLEYIGYGTFRYMNSLTGLTIPHGCFVADGALTWVFGVGEQRTTPFQLTIPDDATVDMAGGLFRYGSQDISHLLNNNMFEVENNICYAGPVAIKAVDKTLTSYTVRNGTRFIDNSAFRDCTNATAITIPSTVENIGGLAFNGCTGLTNGNDVTYLNNVLIDVSPYYSSSAFTPQSGTKVINGYVSYNNINSNIKELTIPGTVKYVYGASLLLNQVHTVNVENGVKYLSLDIDMFNNYGGYITAVTIPSSVEYGGGFEKTRVPVYNSNVYLRCPTTATTAIVQSGIKRIAGGAFSDCTGLTNLTIFDSVKDIGYQAFGYCSSLVGVTMPDSVETAIHIFFNCNNLSSLSLSKNLKMVMLNFAGNHALSALTIPDGIECIDSLNFSGATQFRTLNIGKDVKVIANDIIGNNGRFLTINCYATTAPQIPSNLFKNMNTSGYLHYPSGSDYSAWASALSSRNWTCIGDL